MKTSKFPLCCLLWVAITFAYADQTIVLIRHGEKPDAGLGQLTCKGLNRALALPKVLLTKFGLPVAISAPNPGFRKDDGGTMYNYIRPLATIEPTAIRAGMTVNSDLGFSNTDGLVSAVLKPEYANGVVFVAWEHKEAVNATRTIVKQYGGDPQSVPQWDKRDFDRIYVVHLKDIGASRKASFEIQHQDLNGVAEACPGG